VTKESENVMNEYAMNLKHIAHLVKTNSETR